MTITVNQGEDSILYWVPNYNIQSTSSYDVTFDDLKYPSWLSRYLTVSDQTDENSIQYKTIQFAFAQTNFPEEVFTIQQTQRVREKINCHVTLFEYRITVQVGLCIDKCSSLLTVPTIDPSIYNYQLDESARAEEIALPGFWTYPSTQFKTVYSVCGRPAISMTGIN